MATVPRYNYNRGPQIQGGNIRPIDSGAATMAGQMVEATRMQSQATQGAYDSIQNAGYDWQNQMNKLQLADADTKLSRRYRERLFETKVNNKFEKSIGLTERETVSLEEIDNEEFYGNYSTTLRMHLETLNANKKNKYLTAVQSYELTEAGRYEAKTVKESLNESIQEMTDSPINNVNSLYEQAIELRAKWGDQYPIQVQKSIDQGFLNAYKQWAWDTPDLNAVKQSITDNGQELKEVLGANYVSLMPAVLTVESARNAEANRIKAKSKEDTVIAREQSQLKYLVDLELNQLNIQEVMLNPALKPFGSGSKQWFLNELNKRGEEEKEPPKYSDYTTWSYYHEKASTGDLTDEDMTQLYRDGSSRKVRMEDIGSLTRLNRSMITNSDKPLNRSIKDAHTTLKRRILGGSYLWGGKSTVERKAYNAIKEFDRQVKEWQEDETISNTEILSRITDPNNKNYIVDQLALSFSPTRDEIRQDKRDAALRARGEQPVTPTGQPELIRQGEKVDRMPNETPEEYLKRIGQ